jgi:tetratricopeptide (TPR) repeat protein
MFKDYGSRKGFEWVKEVLINAYAVTGNEEAVAEIMNAYRLTSDISLWRQKAQVTAKEFLRVGDKQNADKYFNEVLNSFEDQSTALSIEERELMAYAYFYKADYKKAEEMLRSILKESPESTQNKSYLAMSLFKTGKEKEASSLINNLDAQRDSYQYGAIDYAKARYYALSGDEDQMIQYLIRAVAAGKRFTSHTFQHDILMKPYVQSASFIEVMNFWH